MPALRRPQIVTSAAPGVAQAVSSSANSNSRLKNDSAIDDIKLAFLKPEHNSFSGLWEEVAHRERAGSRAILPRVLKKGIDYSRATM